MRVITVAILLALAGCADDVKSAQEPTESDPSDVSSTSDDEAGLPDDVPPPSEWTMTANDCAGDVVYAPIDHAQGVTMVPDGFTVFSYGLAVGGPDDPLSATAYFFAVSCQETQGAT